MRNMRDTIFYLKTNVFARFSYLHKCTFKVLHYIQHDFIRQHPGLSKRSG